MKYAALILALMAPAYAQLAKPVASVTAIPAAEPAGGSRPLKLGRGSFAELEKRLDGSLMTVGSVNEPLDLLGPTRGVYIDGFGMVFTSEFSLVLAPSISPFMLTISKETVARIHSRKTERLTQLRKTMREMMRLSALALPQLPENQQLVLVFRLDYQGWEDTRGLPGQISMRADRRTAMSGEEIRTEEN
jgi:hypothetical protein